LFRPWAPDDAKRYGSISLNETIVAESGERCVVCPPWLASCRRARCLTSTSRPTDVTVAEFAVPVDWIKAHRRSRCRTLHVRNFSERGRSGQARI